MAFDAGSAVGRYTIDISDAEAKVKRLEALFSGLARQSSAVGGGGGASQARQAAQSNQAAERAILARAAAEARLAQVQNTGANRLQGLIQAERIYADALSKVNSNTVSAINAQAQLAAIQNRIASQAGGGLPVLPRTLESFGTQAIDQFKSGLLGLVGPAALVSGAFAAAGRSVQAFQDGLALKGRLDETTASLQIQLRGVRDSRIVFEEAANFAQRYGLTQEETNKALASSVGILRNSKSSAEDLLGVLTRLQIVSPEQGLEGAALAVKELSGGDIQSLVERFEISRSTANKMKDEIKKGADAVQVLRKYLDDAGVSMDALKTRTEGVAGAQRNLAQAQERFSLALGTLASSNGAVAAINALATGTDIYARILNGDGVNGLVRFGIEQGIAEAKARAYNDAIKAGKSETEAAAIAERAAEMATRAVSEAFGAGLLPAEAYRSALQRIKAEADSAALSLEGVRAADPFKGKKGALGSRTSDPSRGLRLQASQDAAEAEKARRDQILATGTLAQRVAIRQQEYAEAVKRYGANSAEAIKAQTALIREQQSAAKGVQSGLDKQLRTQEGIYDSLAKQRDAMLDIEELTIRDRQQDREDAVKRRTAERILNSPNATAEMKARAADALALIDVQDRKRAAEIANKSAAAGASIINGKLYQSVGGGAAPGAAPTGAAGASPAPAQAGAAGGGNVVTLRLVDSAGRVLADSVGPIIMEQLLAGAQAVALQRGL